MNCEGAEFPILLTTPAETLRLIRKMLVYYHCDLVDDRYSVAQLESHLRAAGFELDRRESSAKRGRILAELTA